MIRLPIIHVISCDLHEVSSDISTPIKWSNLNIINDGDIIYYNDSYRSNSIYIYINKNIERIPCDGAAYSFVTPRIINISLNNGHNLKDIVNMYKEYIDTIIYPMSYQKMIIINNNGTLEKVFGFYEGKECMIDTDSGIDEFKYEDIFLYMTI